MPSVATLVVSDLHLGSSSDTDVLRGPGPALDALLGALGGVGRLVVAGDLLELRHGPPRTILDRARPVLARLGAGLDPGAEVLLLAGNHDHRIVAPWLDRVRDGGDPIPLAAVRDPGAVSALAEAVADALAPARVRIAYPAAWLVEPDVGPDGTAVPGTGVLVTHGHYIDAVWSMPTMERLSAGLAARTHGLRTDDARTPDDFERLLAPGYGWMQGLAEHAVGRGASRSQRTSASVWARLNDDRAWSSRALRAAVPGAVAALRRAGIGTFGTRLTPEALRRAGLVAMGDVAARLGVRPAHLIVGHTHRAGPLPGDDDGEWRLPSGGRLWNAGSWVDDGSSPAPDLHPRSPYRPGRAVEIGADGEPRLRALLPGTDDGPERHRP